MLSPLLSVLKICIMVMHAARRSARAPLECSTNSGSHAAVVIDDVRMPIRGRGCPLSAYVALMQRGVVAVMEQRDLEAGLRLFIPMLFVISQGN